VVDQLRALLGTGAGGQGEAVTLDLDFRFSRARPVASAHFTGTLGVADDQADALVVDVDHQLLALGQDVGRLLTVDGEGVEGDTGALYQQGGQGFQLLRHGTCSFKLWGTESG